MAAIHQVNHPGAEYPFRNQALHQQNYSFYPNHPGMGVRLWNRCYINGKSNPHYRKFIESKGRYVNSLSNSQEKPGLLWFWGEYEGHSEFRLLNRQNGMPIYLDPVAVHKPFFCSQNINDQNTDPFIFGENFYYAVCQRARLKNLSNGDIVLFGSEFGKKGNVQFHLDLLFVVKDEHPSILSGLYTDVYQESTLKRIGISPSTNGTMTVKNGVKFFDKQDMFSFFPAKVYESSLGGFGRPVIDTISLGLRIPGARTGTKSRGLNPNEDIQSIWNVIAKDVLKQGFVLGTHMNDLPVLPNLPIQPI